MNLLKMHKLFAVKSYTAKLMLYTLFGLIVADGLMTQFLVTNGHASEANPFVEALVYEDLFLATKILSAFLVTSLLWIKYNVHPALIYRAISVFTAIYTGIVFWSLFVSLSSQL